MTISAPPPSLGFSIGITGHRPDRIDDPLAVRARLDELLYAIQNAITHNASSGLYEAGQHPLRLVSALADGADRLAADAALDLGQDVEAVLPFTATEYEKDFDDPDVRQKFHHLLECASAAIVLDGDQIQDRAIAYESAGLTLLDNCDMLVAVWDGIPGRGRGGTREVMGEAARRGMPVVVIPPDGSGMTIFGGPHVEPMRFEDVPQNPIDILPDLIAALVGNSGDVGEEAEWRSLADLPSNPIIHGAYPILLKLSGVRPWFQRGSAWQPPKPEGAVEEAFAWWDNSAIQAAQNFRSAVIVNFGLAALSVVLAATSVLSSDAKKYFVIAEIVTILLLLANTMHAGRMRWQERWLESRQVAELLRVGKMLRSVGIGRGIADPGGGGSNGWYASAIARSCSMETVDLSDPGKAAEKVLAEVRDQASWNEATSHRMHLAAHRIEKFGEVLFVTVLAAAVGWLVLYFTMHELALDLKYPLTALTAGFPAIATASYGIRVILDFEGVANRAKKISLGLNALLTRWEAGEPSSVALQDFARSAADIMLGDVAAWRLLAEGRRLTIPG